MSVVGESESFAKSSDSISKKLLT